MATTSARRSSTVTAEPRSGWWSWRLTPWIVTVPPVDQQPAFPHLDPPEAGDLADHLDDLADRVPQRDQDDVAIGLLRRPRSDAGDGRREVDHVAVEEVGRGHVGDGAGQRSADGSTVEPFQLGLDRPAGLDELRPGEGHRGPDPQHALSEVIGQAGVDADVAQVDRRPGLQVHLPMEAGHPPVVLVLQVAVGRPAHDHAGEDVLTRLQVGGDVELAGQPGVGARAGEAAVDVDEEHALRAAHVEHDLAAPPRPRQAEPRPVHPCRVLVRDGRRGTGEGHLDVRVDRGVGRALQRPARRDVDPPPGPVVSRGADVLGRHGLRPVQQHEGPSPVQRAVPRRVRRAARAGRRRVGERHERAAHRQPVQASVLGPAPRRRRALAEEGTAQRRPPPNLSSAWSAAGRAQLCTQTTVPIGIRFWAQMKSMAGVLTRTQPWLAG